MDITVKKIPNHTIIRLKYKTELIVLRIIITSCAPLIECFKFFEFAPKSLQEDDYFKKSRRAGGGGGGGGGGTGHAPWVQRWAGHRVRVAGRQWKRRAVLTG